MWTQAKLIWIGFIFQSSTSLFTVKKGAPTMGGRATAPATPELCWPYRRTYTRQDLQRLQESPEWVQTDLGNIHTLPWGDRPGAMDCEDKRWWKKCISLDTWGSASLRKTRWSNQTKHHHRYIAAFLNSRLTFSFPVSKEEKQMVLDVTCNNIVIIHLKIC